MEPSIKLFLEEHQKFIFGPGRAELLRSIDTLGSLKKAAEEQGMSYRWAWGRIREAEKALGIHLLMPDTRPGAGNIRVLTPEARELLEWFFALEEKIQAVAREARKSLPVFLKGGDRSSDTSPGSSGKPRARHA